MEAYLDLSDYADLSVVVDNSLADVNLFETDPTASLNDCDVRFDIPSPPVAKEGLNVESSEPTLPLLDWQPGPIDDINLTVPTSEDVNSFMLELNLFSNGSISTLELSTPTPNTSSTSSSPCSENGTMRPLILVSPPVRKMSCIAETPPTSADENLKAKSQLIGTVAVTTPTMANKRPFTLADVDHSANRIKGNNLGLTSLHQGTMSKKIKSEYSVPYSNDDNINPCVITPLQGTNNVYPGNGNGTRTGIGISTGSPFGGDDEQPEVQRSVHNVLERKRRDDLRASFDGLRVAVPDLRLNDKSPKVGILKGASQHIKHLRANQNHLIKQQQALLDTQASLSDRLQRLQLTFDKIGLPFPPLC